MHIPQSIRSYYGRLIGYTVLLQFPPQQSAHIIMASEDESNREEVVDEEFEQAFGGYTRISQRCRNSIHHIKENNGPKIPGQFLRRKIM